jgi:hypothetical protein
MLYATDRRSNSCKNHNRRCAYDNGYSWISAISILIIRATAAADQEFRQADLVCLTAS